MKNLLGKIPVRIRAGAWIAFATFVATVLSLVIENIASFGLSEITQAIMVILLTATVSQITKALNSEK